MLIQAPVEVSAVLRALNVGLNYSPNRPSRTFLDLNELELVVGPGAYLVINRDQHSTRHTSIEHWANIKELQEGSRLSLEISKSNGATILNVPANVELSFRSQEGVVLDQREWRTNKQLLISDAMLREAMKSPDEILRLVNEPVQRPRAKALVAD